MSLAKQIAARMLAKKPAAAPAEKSTAPRVVSPPAGHKRPEPTTPPVPMAERRQRIADGHKRRNAPIAEPECPGCLNERTLETTTGEIPCPACRPAPAPVPTSAPRDTLRERINAGPRAGLPPISDQELQAVRDEARAVLETERASQREEPAGVEVFGEPLPPPRPTPAPPSAAIVAAALAAPEKEAAAAALEEQKANIEATAKWKSQCKAIDARTGLRCGLMHGHSVDHRHARGAFVTIAQGRLVARSVDSVAWADRH